MGIQFEDILSSVSSALFPKPDYIIKSEDTPWSLPATFRDSLLVSEEYYVFTHVSLKSQQAYQGNPLRVSISFDNKGKNPVEQPRIVVYFTDFMYRVWGVWNHSITNGIFGKKYGLEYHFPPLDQKSVGTWAIFALLYDDAKAVLVSYEFKTFTVTDVAPQPWWHGVLIGVVFLGGGFIVGYAVSRPRKIYNRLRGLLRPRKNKEVGAHKKKRA